MLSRHALQAIAFDFDGTLADSRIDFTEMRAALHATVSRFMQPPSDSGMYILEWLETAESELAETSAPQAALLKQATLKTIEEIEVAAARRGQMFSGAVHMLQQLKSAGISTYIVTRNCRAGVLAMLPEAYSLCTGVFTRDDVTAVKPDPRHLTQALAVCGCPAQNALMVGDHPMDILMGKQAGAVTAGVTTGEGNHETLQQAGADYIADSLQELMQSIGPALAAAKQQPRKDRP
ncbi:HAD family hydrolase [Oleidesulfovibrio alaskensis]|uniref:HAD family hydrolase n=1 Tax=Oleidesulfovibrio alaskensis TaxID=58180 RepID=UPI001A612894|nr:HAD family hydrolase [Oleidesulfovibrio alaskensis]MBL3583340.1 HAD family hydrolase [Oleidesulfovibrio alaskensis]